MSKNILNNSVWESKLLISEEYQNDLASDDLVSNDDSSCIVPIPHEEVVELRTSVHDTKGTFTLVSNNGVKSLCWMKIKLALGMIGLICLVPNWRMHSFVFYV